MVTDGFTGNVVLKTSEGAAAAINAIIKREILATTMGKLGALFLRGTFARLKRTLDVDEHGGAPLVGVDGIAVLDARRGLGARHQERHSRRGQLRRRGAARRR